MSGKASWLAGVLYALALNAGASGAAAIAGKAGLVERGAQAFVTNSGSALATSVATISTSSSSVTSSSADSGSTVASSVSTGGSSVALTVSPSTTSVSLTATGTESPSTSPASASAASQTAYIPPSVQLPAVTPNAQITSPAYTRLTHLLPNVVSHAVAISQHSWEIGTLCNALAELYYPLVSPFSYVDSSNPGGDEPYPILQVLVASMWDYDWTFSPSSLGATTPTDLWIYLDADTAPVRLWPKALSPNDQALGDPVAMGTAAWITAHLIENVSTPIDGAQSGADYAWAVGNQLAHLREGVTSSNGTISQREGVFQLWSDMNYMIPPVPAYLGLSAHNDSLMQLGLDQWVLETSALLDTDQNLYRHINQQDNGFWATGNGWALLGLVRLIALFEAAKQTPPELEKAKQEASAMFGSLFQQLDSDNLLPDYMLQDNATLAIGDVAGTAAVAAAYYRFYTLCPESATDALSSGADAAFTGVVNYVGDDGFATHVVDPMGTYGLVVYPNDPTLHSPEAQSFIGMMWAARTAAGI